MPSTKNPAEYLRIGKGRILRDAQLQLRLRAIEHEEAVARLHTRWLTPWEIVPECQPQSGNGRWWILVPVLLTIALIVAVVSFSAMPSLVRSGEDQSSLGLINTDQLEDFVAEVFSAESVGQLERYVRNPTRTGPRMTKYYADRPFKKFPAIKMSDLRYDTTIGDTDFTVLGVTEGTGNLVAIAVEKISTGFAFDWEFFVGYSDDNWAEHFLKNEPEEACDFRVYVQRSEYFNYHYDDPQEFLCVKVIDANDTGHCWAYCRVDSSVGAKMDALLGSQARENLGSGIFGESDDLFALSESNFVATPILRLRFQPEGKGRRQVWIEDLVSDYWIVE